MMGLSGDFDEMFSRFDTKHACDTQTYTDGNAVAYTRASIASRG